MISGFTYVLGQRLKNLILRDETFRVFHEITEYVKSLERADAFFRAKGSGSRCRAGMAGSLIAGHSLR